MQAGKLLLVICVAGVLAFSACTKPRTQAFDYTFENLTDKSMNVDIYYSQADYFNNTNVVAHGSAKVRGYYVLPLSTFETGHVYFVDIYSDDYLYNNWFWTNVTLRDTFLPSQLDYDYIIHHTQYADASRLIWLNGAGPTTTWKAFNAYSYSGSSYTSIWSTLTPGQKNLQIVLQKSSWAVITNGAGTDTTKKYQAFYDQTTNVSTLSILNPDQSVYGTLTSNFNASAYAFNGSKDTMLANIGGLGYFAMARQ